jgi:hypothetical protein
MRPLRYCCGRNIPIRIFLKGEKMFERIDNDVEVENTAEEVILIDEDLVAAAAILLQCNAA